MGGYLRRVLRDPSSAVRPVLVVLGSMLFKAEGTPPARRCLDYLVLRSRSWAGHLPSLRQPLCQGVRHALQGRRADHRMHRARHPRHGQCGRSRNCSPGDRQRPQGGMAWEGFSPRLPAEYLHLWQIGEEIGRIRQDRRSRSRRSPPIGPTCYFNAVRALVAEGGLLRRPAHRGLHDAATGHASVRRSRYLDSENSRRRPWRRPGRSRARPGCPRSARRC